MKVPNNFSRKSSGTKFQLNLSIVYEIRTVNLHITSATLYYEWKNSALPKQRFF